MTLILAAGGLTYVNIPNTVTTIGNSAFAGCGRLTSISLPASLTEIGNQAFRGCTGLTSIDLSGCTSLTTINSGAFKKCTGLTSISLPASLTEIGNQAFDDCAGLTSAVFTDPNGWKANSTPIDPTYLANTTLAAIYLREWSSNGGYCDKHWKKN